MSETCAIHAQAQPCPWPNCRAAAGIAGLIYEGRQARHFVCGKCRQHAWVWVPLGEAMPEIDHPCVGAVTA